MISNKKKQTKLEVLMLTVLPMIGTVAMVLSYVPQLKLTYTTHNVEGQSLSFWILLTVGLISMIGQQIGLIKYRNANSYTGIVFQILNTSLAAAMLIAVLVFS